MSAYTVGPATFPIEMLILDLFYAVLHKAPFAYLTS